MIIVNHLLCLYLIGNGYGKTLNYYLNQKENERMNNMTPENIHAEFLDYFNNYLTVELFAEHRDWSVTFAKAVIKEGRAIHEAECKEYKEDKDKWAWERIIGALPTS